VQTDIGDLDRRIVIQRATYGRDAVNAKTATWNTLATIWASYSAVSDGEKFASGQINANISARFVIRYSTGVADVNPKDRLQFDGKTYDIIAAKETERRRWIEITAATQADGT
jgi:SPP1 family predicted phage head-tail adaptor